MDNRSRILVRNTRTSIACQLTTILCGFILPRLILGSFGSEAYGLVGSIVGFLSIISYLDLGMSAVVQSALYKPLAERNVDQISAIVISSEKFFRNIARILVVYVYILIICYPLIVNSNFSFIYIATLILAISVSSFAQYYFGITNQLLLCADQKLYIPNIIQIGTLIANTATCAFLLYIGCSIQIVYLTTSIIYLFRPVYYYLYVKKHYQIYRDIKIEKEPIEQKWNGVAQHIATVVLGSTNTLVLSLFSTLQNVAIYNVYYLVVSGINKLFSSATAGFQSYYGDLWAKQEVDELKASFNSFVWVVHTCVVFIFGCAAVLIVPFVKVYTLSIADANYDVPLFGLLICLAYGVYCIRLPYNLIVLACNHYKQTQHSYIVATFINIILSVVTVKFWGLIGVTSGVLCAMSYQTVWMAYYVSNNLIKWPFKLFIKQILVDAVSFVIPFTICRCIFHFEDVSVINWIVLSLKTVAVWSICMILVNCIFYKSEILALIRKITRH